MSRLNTALKALRSYGGALGLGAGAGAAAAYFTGKTAVDLVGKPVLEGVGRGVNARRDLLELAQYLKEEHNRNLGDQMRSERLQRLMAENTLALAQYAPDLYNQVLAGRRLPRGAVVLGGQGSDRLQQLALAMSTGGFNQPTAEQQYLGQQ